MLEQKHTQDNCLHSNKLVSYCSTCKLFACKDCSEKHIPHGLKNLTDIIEKYRTEIMQFKERYDLLINQSSGKISQFQADSELFAKSIVSDYESKLAAIMADIRAKLMAVTKEIKLRCEETIKQLSNRTIIDEIAKKLSKFDEAVQTNDYKMIINLAETNISNKYKETKDCIELLVEDCQKLRIKTEDINKEIVKNFERVLGISPTKKINSPKEEQKSHLIQKLKVEQEIEEIIDLNESAFLHFFEINQRNLYIYYIDTAKTFKINGENLKIPLYHGSVQVEEGILFCGGFETAQIEYLKSTNKLEILINETGSWIKKADMKFPKSHHKLVAFSKNLIYSIGGKKKGDTFYSVCEIYEIDKDNWKLAPELNEKKCLVSATSFNLSAIYTFGGFNGGGLSTIEVIQPFSDNKWTIIQTKKSEDWTARSEVGSFQLSDTEIMVFGGVIHKKACTDDVFIFDTNKNSMGKAPYKLEEKEWFSYRTIVKHQNRISIIGYVQKGMHVFDFHSKQWRVIPEKDWRSKSKWLTIN